MKKRRQDLLDPELVIFEGKISMELLAMGATPRACNRSCPNDGRQRLRL